MVFAYYHNLSKNNQTIYDESDALKLPRFKGAKKNIQPLVTKVQSSLASGVRIDTERATRALLLGLCESYQVAKISVKVLSFRPSDDYGELHGLYVRDPRSRRWPQISVWMRTAQHKRIVAPKTFIRTVLHEFMHHLDFEYFDLEDSFHTEGFFKREATLFHIIKGGLR